MGNSPGVGVPALQGPALASGCDEAWPGRSSGTWGLGTPYQGARRGSQGAWGRRLARKACWAPSAWWVGGTKLAPRPQLKLAVSLRGNEHACQPPRSPLPRQAICRPVSLSPPGSPSSSHLQGLEALCSEAAPCQGPVSTALMLCDLRLAESLSGLLSGSWVLTSWIPQSLQAPGADAGHGGLGCELLFSLRAGPPLFPFCEGGQRGR